MTEKQQRDFLKAVAGEVEPATFADTSGTFMAFLARLRFSSPHKHVRGPEEIAELALAEASGGPWSGTQAEFLRQCAQDVNPLIYRGTDGKARPVLLARVSVQTPHRGPRGAESVVQIRMVDAVEASRWLPNAHRAKIAETLTALTICVPDARYDYSEIGFAQYY